MIPEQSCISMVSHGVGPGQPGRLPAIASPAELGIGFQVYTYVQIISLGELANVRPLLRNGTMSTQQYNDN